MSVKQLFLVTLVAFVWPVAAEAQVFEITRELGAPQHNYFNNPPFGTSTTDALPVPALPNVQFAITGNATIRLRLVAPPGKKFVATQAINLSWPGDLNLIPTGSMNSGTLHVCPTSWSFTTLAGTAPVSTVEGYKTDADWLKIRATATSTSSANFEFTELVLNWNVTGFTGATHTYAMSDGGGWITGPEIDLYRTLSSGAPDPGQFVFLQDIVVPCTGGNTWEVCGAPVGVQPGGQVEQYLSSDGAGGTFISFTHWDSINAGNNDVWLHHLNSSGLPAAGWPAAAAPVCELARDQNRSRVVADGSGGAYVAWQDNRDDPVDGYVDIYLNRMTSSGSVAPGWPANGLNIQPLTPFVDHVLNGLISDGTGGVFASWSSTLNRYTGSGTVSPGWPAAGLTIGGGSTQIVADGAGGVYVCWLASPPSLRITRVTGSGAFAAGWSAAGLSVSTQSISSFAVDVGSGGSHVNIAWIQTNGSVAASRVTSGGTIAFGWTNSIVLRATSDPKSYLTVANGGASGDAVFAWREDLPAPAGFQVLAQRLTSTGAIASGWPGTGWQVISDGRYLLAFPGCNGGTTLAYVGVSPTNPGIRAIQFTASGAVSAGWPADGVVLCNGSFTHIVPTNRNWAMPDATGGAITCISRIQNGTGSPFNRAHLYAQCVRGDGSADEGYAGPTPTGMNVSVAVGPATVTFANVTVAGETRLELDNTGPPPPPNVQIVPLNAPIYYDVTTLAQYQGPVQVCITYDPATVQGPESALRILHYEGIAPTGTWVDVTTNVDVNANVICGSAQSLSPFILVEADPTDVAGELPRVNRLFANVPNPFNPTTTIQFDLAASGPARLEVLDVSGRLVRTLVNERVETGSHNVTWNGFDNAGRRVASGVYFYRLQAGEFTTTRRMVLLK